jgi:hypothetical protein
MRTIVKLSLIAACALAPSIALANSITVDATDVISAAGTQSGNAAGDGGTTPVAVAVTPGTSYLTFSVGGGPITLDSGGITNDADGLTGGNPAYLSASYTFSSGGISGIKAPGGGYLVGVFLAAGGPGTTAPASLDYTSGGPTTGDSSNSPLLDQEFFIGDGLTGDGTGSTQTFYVPTGATELYLGISDAPAFTGTPGSYSDNSGTFSVTYDEVAGGVVPPSDTPEPSSLALLGTGVLGAAGVLRKKLTRK